MASAGLTAPAQASELALVDAIASSTAIYASALTSCSAQVATVYGAAPASATYSSKASAVLGGQPSMLEQIRLQQAAVGDQGVAQNRIVGNPLLEEIKPIEPALGAIRRSTSGCSTSGFAQTSVTGAASRELAFASRNFGRDDFLQSKRVTLGKTSFDAAWSRVRGRKLRQNTAAGLPVPRGSNGIGLLDTVNRWANQTIAYAEDRQLYGVNDYWADASTTLARRKGDCEDIAIVKMQVLASRGIPDEDMFLTVVKDSIRRADHAVLIVRLGDSYYMLDNASDEVLDASESHEYHPLFSFNDKVTWLHSS
ncbi:MAG TPA: transglutaminase-like cysteine peptidase [Sphingomonadaceae bacterium]|nr:transglutaminase-like cysteine peptidase [Sphingomonadaceae bacterium]